MNKILVSIVINNYNYDDFITDAIESALNQTYENIEVIVVDDGSTDDSRAIIAKYGTAIKSILKENGGQASTFNAGINGSSGDYIIFLDSDDKLYNFAAEFVVEAFLNNPQMVKLAYRLDIIDQASSKTGCYVPRNEENVPIGNISEQVLLYGPRCYETPPTSGNAFSRLKLNDIFPIPLEYRISADSYLFTLAPLLGDLGYIPKSLGGYRIHNSNSFSGIVDVKKLKTEANLYELRKLHLKNYISRLSIPMINPETWRDAYIDGIIITLAKLDTQRHSMLLSIITDNLSNVFKYSTWSNKVKLLHTIYCFCILILPKRYVFSFFKFRFTPRRKQLLIN